MSRIILLCFILSQTPTADTATPGTFALKVLDALPTWEADALAQYEQPELSLVRLDLEEIAEGEGTEEQLHADWSSLVALDNALKTRRVI